jgi:hypothetical protein
LIVNHKIKEHDTVALTEDRTAEGLRRGDVGAVVHVYHGKDAFEVEFVDEHGKTKCVATMSSGQIMRLNVMPQSA